MSQAVELRQDFQLGLDEIDQAIEQTDNLTVHHQKENSELEAITDKMGQVITQFEEGDEAYEKVLADLIDNLQSNHTELESSIEDDLSTEAESEELDNFLEELSALKDNTQELCDELEQTLEGQLDQTLTDCQECSETLEQHHQECQECHTEHIQQLQGNQQAYHEGQSNITQLSQTTEQNFAEWIQALREDLTDTLKNAFEGHHEAIDQHGEAMTGDLQSFQQETSEAINSHHQTCDGLGEELKSRCCEAIENVSNHATEVLQRELDKAFKHVMDKVIEEVLEEIVKNIAMAELGAATTTAISPILPEIVIAKKALELINEILSLGGLFD
jgi:DNA repair exonuclease SbcCD ATPase subunit